MSASLLRNLNANEVIMRIENEDSDDMLETQSVPDSDPDFVFIQEFDEDEENWQGVKSKKLSNYAQRSSTVVSPVLFSIYSISSLPITLHGRVPLDEKIIFAKESSSWIKLQKPKRKAKYSKKNGDAVQIHVLSKIQRQRQCASLTEDERQWVFKNFRKMESWSERRSYVRASVSKVNDI
ncbi:uncharacterized protein LOC144425792 [Styela clava]